MEEGSMAISYNALNQPKLAWSNGTQGAYLWFGFDPLGRCVKRWYAQGDGSGATPVMYFVYDGWNLVQEGTSPWSPSHFYFHGARVDEIVASYNGVTGVMAYHYYDASGHCTMLTDWQGNIMEQYYYDAFGYPYFFDGLGNGLGYSPHGNRFLFTGREWIEPLKVYDFRNRLYHPELGRFMQPDPKEFAAGDYNLYRYCHNDPVNKSDPLGLDTYVQARDLEWLGGGVHWSSKWEGVTHTFVFTTNPDGSVAHTYSWGNTQNTRGWNKDQSLDKQAAQQALTFPKFVQDKVGNSSLDPYIQKAYDMLNKKENEHGNHGVFGNCKSEAAKLISLARQLQKQDQVDQKRNATENRTIINSHSLKP